MKIAPRGHYKTIIGDEHPNVRIAFTHTPMHGVTRLNCDSALALFEASDDEFAEYYANGLKSGTMVVIVPHHAENRYFKSGELFFTT